MTPKNQTPPKRGWCQSQTGGKSPAEGMILSRYFFSGNMWASVQKKPRTVIRGLTNMGDDGTIETRLTTVDRIITLPSAVVSSLTHVPKRHTVTRTLRPAAIFLRLQCADMHRQQPGNMPRAEAGRGPIVCAFGMCGPSSLHSGLTGRTGCPFTHKPGARKAGEADRRNRKAQIALATGPRHGFLIRRSSPPACHVHRQGCRKAGQRVRLVLCLNKWESCIDTTSAN